MKRIIRKLLRPITHNPTVFHWTAKWGNLTGQMLIYTGISLAIAAGLMAYLTRTNLEDNPEILALSALNLGYLQAAQGLSISSAIISFVGNGLRRLGIRAECTRRRRQLIKRSRSLLRKARNRPISPIMPII